MKGQNVIIWAISLGLATVLMVQTTQTLGESLNQDTEKPDFTGTWISNCFNEHLGTASFQFSAQFSEQEGDLTLRAFVGQGCEEPVVATETLEATISFDDSAVKICVDDSDLELFDDSCIEIPQGTTNKEFTIPPFHFKKSENALEL